MYSLLQRVEPFSAEAARTHFAHSAFSVVSLPFASSIIYSFYPRTKERFSTVIRFVENMFGCTNASCPYVIEPNIGLPGHEARCRYNGASGAKIEARALHQSRVDGEESHLILLSVWHSSQITRIVTLIEVFAKVVKVLRKFQTICLMRKNACLICVRF